MGCNNDNPGIRRVRFQEDGEDEENIYASIRQSNDNTEDEVSGKRRQEIKLHNFIKVLIIIAMLY